MRRTTLPLEKYREDRLPQHDRLTYAQDFHQSLFPDSSQYGAFLSKVSDQHAIACCALHEVWAPQRPPTFPSSLNTILI